MKSSLFFSKKVGSYSDGWGEVVEQDRRLGTGLSGSLGSR